VLATEGQQVALLTLGASLILRRWRMIVRRVIEELKKQDENAVVIIKGEDKGWSNIGDIVKSGSNVEIEMDSSRPFSSDN